MAGPPPQILHPHPKLAGSPAPSPAEAVPPCTPLPAPAPPAPFDPISPRQDLVPLGAGLAAPCPPKNPGSHQGNPEDGAKFEEVPARLRAPPMKLWEGDAGLLRVLLLCVWLETATGCVYRCGTGQ